VRPFTARPRARAPAAHARRRRAGTFEELRAAGLAQGRWLLVNIQSPTEFASQQLNADTWRDETLTQIIGARRATA